MLFTKNGVDGVYSADPKSDPTATKFDELTYDDVVQRPDWVIDVVRRALTQTRAA